jgi:hypothetical protein
MIWLIVLISLDGGPQQAIEQIRYADLQSCQAEKLVRETRVATHPSPRFITTFVCRDSAWSPRMF